MHAAACALAAIFMTVCRFNVTADGWRTAVTLCVHASITDRCEITLTLTEQGTCHPYHQTEGNPQVRTHPPRTAPVSRVLMTYV